MAGVCTPLPEFRGEPAELRDKLNALVRRVNELSALFGDSYIEVRETSAGRVIGINVERLVEAIPGLPAPPTTDAVLFYNATTGTIEWIATTDECP